MCVWFFFFYCYAAMYPTGVKSAVCSRQVHQLMQGPYVGCGLPKAI